MQSPYPHLLTPLVRRGIVIRNRMGMSRAYPPFSTGVESTEVRESLIPYAQYMARNGAAIVTLPSGRGQNPDSRPMKQPFPPPEPAGSGAEPPDPFAEGGGPPPPGAMGGPDLSIANVKLTYIHAVQAIHDQGSLAMGSLMELEPSGWEFDEIPAEALDRLTTLFASRCRLYRDLGFDGAGFCATTVLCLQSPCPASATTGRIAMAIRQPWRRRRLKRPGWPAGTDSFWSCKSAARRQTAVIPPKTWADTSARGRRLST